MPAILFKVFILLACCIACLSPGMAQADESAADPSFYFMALTDIHFDPFTACYTAHVKPCPLIQRLRTAPASQWSQLLAEADTEEPRYRLDTNYVLLRKSLEEVSLAAAKRHPDFVVVLGDTVGHDFLRYYRKYSQDSSVGGYQVFVKKTLEFINLELAATFPDTSVFMITGNNDTYSQDYQSVPGGSFFGDMGALWSTLIKNTNDRVAMRHAFSQAGYYAVDVPKHPELRLIAINSVLFSVKSAGKRSAAAADVQLNWLHQQLQLAKNNHQQVLLALHIPPRIDAYAMRHWRLFTLQQFWRPEYLQRFQNELAEFYPQISGILAGHLHYDWMQELEVDYNREVSVIGVPSISPIFGNDPAFKVYHYTPAVARIDHFDTYLYPVGGAGVWSVQRTVE